MYEGDEGKLKWSSSMQSIKLFNLRKLQKVNEDMKLLDGLVRNT